MTLFDNLLTIFILSVLGVIIYCKVTKKTLIDFVKEVRGSFASEDE